MKRSIIFLNRYFFPDHSATSQLLSDLAFEVAKSGARVTIVTSRQIYDDPGHRLPARQVIEGVAVHRVWSTRFGRGHLWGRVLDYVSFYLSSALLLLFLLRRGDLVIVKTDPPLIGMIAAPIVALRRARHAHWVQDVFPEIAAREIFWLRGPPGWALKWMRNAVLRRASFIVVLSGAMRRHLIAEGIAEDKFFVIPNWSDGATVSPLAAEDNPLRGSWSLRDKFVIGYSGNLGRVHDGQTFLDAAALLESDPAMVFLFIGGGAKRKEIEDRVRRSGVANVQFKPYQAQGILNQSLALPDVHLVSLRPGFEDLVYPSKIAGASAAGRPIIFVGDTDGDLARTILDARAGFVVSCGDGGGLAKRLRELKSDAALGREMGENARNLHEKKFARHQALAAWMELLRRRQM